MTNNEVLESILEVLSRPKGKRKWWVRILDSKYAVPIISGLILAIVGGWLQNRSTEAREAAAKTELVNLKKYETMTMFADGITRYLNIIQSVKRRGIMLSNFKNANSVSNQTQLPDGSTFRDSLELYENSVVELNKLSSPDALCAQAMALFRKDGINLEIKDLDNKLDALAASESLTEVEVLFDQCSEKYQEIIIRMGETIFK